MNFKAFLNVIIQTLQSLILTDAPEVVATIATFMENAKDRLAAVAQSYLEDDDVEFVKSSLADESKILQAQLLALEIAGEQIAKEIADRIISLVESLIINQENNG